MIWFSAFGIETLAHISTKISIMRTFILFRVQRVIEGGHDQIGGCDKPTSCGALSTSIDGNSNAEFRPQNVNSVILELGVQIVRLHLRLHVYYPVYASTYSIAKQIKFVQ